LALRARISNWLCPRASANGPRWKIAAGRLLPWLAVAYGFGIVLYFTAGREPAWEAAVALAASAAIRRAASASLPTARVAYVLAPDAFEEDCRRGDTRRSAARLRSRSYRAQGMARSRRSGAPSQRLELCDRYRAAGQFRPAMGAGSAAPRAYGCRYG
jgi:hypothetical protein